MIEENMLLSIMAPVIPHVPWPWEFATQRRDDIQAYFALKAHEKPMWNGSVLLMRTPVFQQGQFRCTCFTTDFASFLFWRDQGWPDKSVFNGFGSAALQSSDGAFLAGQMADHTANAGHIYFASGTPEPEDLAGDRLDLASAIRRELAEETGLSADQVTQTPDWSLVIDGQRLALFRHFQHPAPASTLRQELLSNIQAQERPEFSDIVILTQKSALPSGLPPFMQVFLEAYLTG